MSKPEAAKKKKIFLVEDHDVVRQGLRFFIGQEPDMEVCGEAGDAAKALAAIARCEPDAVVCDISLPGMNGIEFLKHLKTEHPRVAAVVLSMHDESVYAERALRAGVRGYVMKKESTEEVVTALRKALNGTYHVSDKVVGSIFNQALAGAATGQRASPSPVALLSDRELEIFELIGRGECTKSIASVLNLSPKTVETHCVHIKEKLGLPTAPDLTRYATLWVENEKVGV